MKNTPFLVALLVLSAGMLPGLAQAGTNSDFAASPALPDVPPDVAESLKPSENPTTGPSWVDNIGLQAGLSWGIGTMGNGTGGYAASSRTVNTLALRGFANYDLRSLLPSLGFRLSAGPLFEFRFVGQNTDPAQADNTNIRGLGYILGLGLGGDWAERRISAIASFDFLGAHWLTNQTPSLQTSELSGLLGFRGVIGYRVKPRVSVDLSYQYGVYHDSNIVKDLGPDAIHQSAFSIGVRYFFRH